MERDGTTRVMAVLLVAVALAAMAEVSARAPARESSAAVLLRLGDEARAGGDAAGARRAYLAGLFRARGERSLAEVLWAAEGFAALGDAAVVAEALAIAAPLAAGGDPSLRARLAALRERGEPAAALPGFDTRIR